MLEISYSYVAQILNHPVCIMYLYINSGP